jgi:hypothetical protein
MDERAELAKMNDRELVAYYNILTMGGGMIQAAPEGKGPRHLGIVCGLLADRGIGYETGRLINRKGA